MTTRDERELEGRDHAVDVVLEPAGDTVDLDALDSCGHEPESYGHLPG